MLFHLIYVSTAILPMDTEDLLALLAQSRDRNARMRVSGMLLYKSGHFMQVLEGDEADVMTIFADIEKDLRHKSVDTLRKEYIQHRYFPNWTMGFENIDNLDAATLRGFTRFLEHDFRSDHFLASTHEAHAMLLAFRGELET